MLSEAPVQTLRDVYVGRAGGFAWSNGDAVPLSQISPLVLSEIVRDLTLLVAR